MRKSKIMPGAVLLITATFFASCSMEKGLTVEKRHYRKGYSVQWHGSNDQLKADAGKVTRKGENENLKEAASLPATINSSSPAVEPVLAASSEPAIAIQAPVEQAVNGNAKTLSTSAVQGNETASQEMAKKYTKADRRELKKLVKAHKAVGQVDMPMWAYIVFAILIPPLAVGLFEGIHGPFWLSILLTLLFWLPGAIYAIWRVTK